MTQAREHKHAPFLRTLHFADRQLKIVALKSSECEFFVKPQIMPCCKTI